jgi:hypothetical protein
MYATDDEVFYIGEAGKDTVWKRFRDHKDDDVIDCLLYNAACDWNVKVGILRPDKRQEFTLGLLKYVQKVLIFEEGDIRDFCKCNVANKESLPDYPDDITIFNVGHYPPLLETFENFSDDDEEDSMPS